MQPTPTQSISGADAILRHPCTRPGLGAPPLLGWTWGLGDLCWAVRGGSRECPWLCLANV